MVKTKLYKVRFKGTNKWVDVIAANRATAAKRFVMQKWQPSTLPMAKAQNRGGFSFGDFDNRRKRVKKQKDPLDFSGIL